MVDENPLYEAPVEDLGRDARMTDWNNSEIKSFLQERYDDPLDEFGAESYDELMGQVKELGLPYVEDLDWRFDQISDLGEKNYGTRKVHGLARKKDLDKIDNPEPWEVEFLDEEGEVQISLDNR